MAASIDRLTEEQIAEGLKMHADWAETGGSIQKTFQFKNFLEAMKFVNRVAEQAETDQHHPDILVRWNKVTLSLSTHDAGGISGKDFELAGKADVFAKNYAPVVVPPPAPAQATGGKSGAGKRGKK